MADGHDAFDEDFDEDEDEKKLFDDTKKDYWIHHDVANHLQEKDFEEVHVTCWNIWRSPRDLLKHLKKSTWPAETFEEVHVTRWNIWR